MTHKKWMKQGTQYYHIYIFWHSNPGEWRGIRSIKQLYLCYKDWCTVHNEKIANEYVWRKKIRECGYENSSTDMINGTVKKRRTIVRKVMLKKVKADNDTAKLVCSFIG